MPLFRSLRRAPRFARIALAAGVLALPLATASPAVAWPSDPPPWVDTCPQGGLVGLLTCILDLTALCQSQNGVAHYVTQGPGGVVVVCEPAGWF